MLVVSLQVSSDMTLTISSLRHKHDPGLYFCLLQTHAAVLQLSVYSRYRTEYWYSVLSTEYWYSAVTDCTSVE